jgi:hypothetical protein
MKISIVLAAVLSAAFAMPALAEKDNTPRRGGSSGKTATHGAGHGSDNGQARGPARRETNQVAATTPRGTRVGADRDRTVPHTYQRNPFAAASCPPGLASKNNGCLPPGQARKL